MSRKILPTGLRKGLSRGMFTGILHGTFNGTYNGLFSSNIYSIFQPETIAWVSQLAFPKPSPFYLFEIDYFIARLKIAGIWKQLDRLWIFATEQQSHARVSLVNPNGINTPWPSNITEVNSPEWTKLQGYTGNGSNSYLNTNFVNGTYYKLNSASIGFYINALNTASSGQDGVYDGTNITSLILNYSSGLDYADLNSLVNNISGTAKGKAGLYIMNRINNSSLALSFNGTPYISGNIDTSAIPTGSQFIMARNDSGSPNWYTNHQYSMAFYGSGSLNQVLLSHHFNLFFTKIGF